MIEFAGTIYYIDMNALDKAVTSNIGQPNDEVTFTEVKEIKDKSGEVISTETTTTTSLRGKEIEGHKYDILRMMIEIVIDYEDDSDTTMGVDRALDGTPLSYKMAFNTLIKNKILVEK